VDEATELILPNLNSFERMIVHGIADKVGLVHVSLGSNAIKDIQLNKKIE
jgi:hypothetical protein